MYFLVPGEARFSVPAAVNLNEYVHSRGSCIFQTDGNFENLFRFITISFYYAKNVDSKLSVCRADPIWQIHKK